MRKLIVAGIFLMIVASDWAWSSSINNFIPKSFAAKFEQQYINQHKKLKKSNGSVDYQYPGNIRFELDGSSNLTIVSNQKKLWYFTPSLFESEPSDLKITDAKQNNIAYFFDILKNGLTSNEDYKVEKNKNSYTISFTKKSSKKIGYLKAVLFFNGESVDFDKITKIELYKNSKSKTSMIFSKIEVGKKFTKKHFEFVPPKNTRISTSL